MKKRFSKSKLQRAVPSCLTHRSVDNQGSMSIPPFTKWFCMCYACVKHNECKTQKDEGVTQLVECLSSRQEAVESIPSTE